MDDSFDSIGGVLFVFDQSIQEHNAGNSRDDHVIRNMRIQRTARPQPSEERAQDF